VLSNNSRPKFDQFWSQYAGRPFQGRNEIIQAICPQLYGMYYVKLCLLLTLIGGSISQPSDRNGIRRRYQSHLLLIGDPGCGKSQLLRFAAGVSRRSVLTTGIGTSSAGLTCSMVKDGPDWEIEAGALVLANDGVCCIDEFASVREQDRATIHEALEQQSLSVAKAGVVVKLNTRATVIACCNPKGSYDPSLDITTNTAIASPLLSRFDLVLILLDVPNKEWDKKVSTFLLQQSVEGYARNHDRTSAKRSAWDMNMISEYISYVKSAYQPAMDRYARALLLRYYQMQRQSDERSSSRTTVRLLESLLRLSEAHAKLMQRSIVELSDAVVAIRCVSLSQTKASILENNATLQSDFPEDGDNFYEEEEHKVFELLVITKERFLETVDEDAAGNAGGDLQAQLSLSMDNAINDRHSHQHDLHAAIVSKDVSPNPSSSTQLPMKRAMSSHDRPDIIISSQLPNHKVAKTMTTDEQLLIQVASENCMYQQGKEQKQYKENYKAQIPLQIQRSSQIRAASAIPVIHDLIDDQDW
jgi:DNA helicase MCM9